MNEKRNEIITNLNLSQDKKEFVAAINEAAKYMNENVLESTLICNVITTKHRLLGGEK